MAVGAFLLLAGAGWQAWGLMPRAATVDTPGDAAFEGRAKEEKAEEERFARRAEQFDQLERELKSLCASAPARRASVHVQDLETGQTAGANADEEFLAASLIKLPVMATAYERWETRPDLKTATAKTWMEWMITVSDNASTDRLIDLVGGPEKVIDFCEQRGWPQFRVRHAILNHRGRRGNNTCTARQVTEFLAALDARRLVNPEADEEMWKVLCRQKRKLRIPAGVPEGPGILVGNKTGTLSNALHDAGIVHTDRTRYAITILLSGQRGEYRGNKFCKEVSRLVFDTLHGPVTEPATEPAIASAR